MSIEAKEKTLADSSVAPAAHGEAKADDEGERVERIIDYCVDPEQSLTNYRLVGVVGVFPAPPPPQEDPSRAATAIAARPRERRRSHRDTPGSAMRIALDGVRGV